MAKYLVDVSVSGYCRGNQTWIVEADSEEEAMENYYCGNMYEDSIVRDDREGEAYSAELIKTTEGE